MADRAGDAVQGERFLVFSVGGRSLALPAGRIREILRVPKLQRVPQAPPALLGLANCRGTVLPVVDIAGGGRTASTTGAARLLVVEAGTPMGLLAESVAGFASGAGKAAPDRRDSYSEGLVRLENGAAAHVVALDRLLAELFPGFRRRSGRVPPPAAEDKAASAPAANRVGLVTFEVSGQDYGLPLERVEEVIALPADLAIVPRADDHVVGVVPVRQGLLAVVSTARLLGVEPRNPGPESKIVVARIGGTRAGLVVDRMSAILRIEEHAVDRVPALLRGEGAEIRAICRLEGGRRLISVLATEGLFNEAVMRRIASDAGEQRAAAEVAAETMDGGQFVLFRVAEDLFGLPVEAVEEVVRVPETLTRLPKAPAFVEGVMNLRGTALPVIDQRRRFDLEPAGEMPGRRIIVLSFEGTRAGFIVDRVTDVRRLPASAILAAPEMDEDQARIVPRVASLEDDTLVLLLDPKALLDTTERRLLAALGRAKARPAA